MRIYLGGPMFTYADIVNNLRLAKQLRENGFVTILRFGMVLYG